MKEYFAILAFLGILGIAEYPLKAADQPPRRSQRAINIEMPRSGRSDPHRIRCAVPDAAELFLYIPGLRDPIEAYGDEFEYQLSQGRSVFYLVPRSQLTNYTSAPDFYPNDIARGIQRTLLEARGRPVVVNVHSISTAVVEEFIQEFPEVASRVSRFIFTSPLLQNILPLQAAWTACSSRHAESVSMDFPVWQRGHVHWHKIEIPVEFYQYYIRLFKRTLSRPSKEQKDVPRFVFIHSEDPVFKGNPNRALPFYEGMAAKGFETFVRPVPPGSSVKDPHNLHRDPEARKILHNQDGLPTKCTDVLANLPPPTESLETGRALPIFD